jgi:hypothetical protein
MEPPVVLAALSGVAVCCASFPDYLVYKVVFPENLVEHYFDIVAGVPIAVVIETPSLFEDSRQFHALWAHELDIGLRGFVPVLECSLLFCLSPEHFVVTIRVERRVNVNKVYAGVRKFLELV